MVDAKDKAAAGNRLAKVIARAGLCSRRDAEKWITAGRVAVNGNVIRTPAFNVVESDKVEVDDNPLASRDGTRVWLYHKPPGLVVTERDPEGRKTIFEELKKHGLPRVLTIGRLDINTEGLLMLTNDGGLKRVLELPSTGWLRRYRVRAHGRITQEQLDGLKKGMELDGIKYGPIEATLERTQGSNVWMVVALREGKNREIKNVLSALGLQVNRLIRTSYGPFQLGDMPVGSVSVVRARILRDQLGHKLAKQAGVDFDSAMPEDEVVDVKQAARNPNQRMRNKVGGKPEHVPKPHGRTGEQKRDGDAIDKPRKSAPHRKGIHEYKPRPEYVPEAVEKRVVHFPGGRKSEEFEPKAKRPKSDDEGGDFKRGPRPNRDDKDRKDRPRGPRRDDKDRARGPRREDGERPRAKPSRDGASRPSAGPRGGKSAPRSGGPRKGPPRGRPSR